MKIETFQLERSQTLYENEVELNLTESGVHPATMGDLVPADELAEVMELPLGYGYTDGTPGLRQAIADWHPGAAPSNVMVGNGTSEANLLALLTLLERGDHIIFITPNFMQIAGFARALEIDVTEVPLSEKDNWQPDPDAIKAAIQPKTRLVTLCDPNNPTGVLMTPESRSALVGMCEETGLWLLIDEIYRGSEIDGRTPVTAWDMGSRVLVTGGLAKSFGCPGLRMGWCIAPDEMVTEMHRRQDYTTIGTGVLAQELSRRALTNPMRDRLLSRGRTILKEGRDRIEAWLAKHNGWAWVKPDASGMAFLSYDLEMSSTAFVEQLRKEQGVFVCAGEWFGIDGHIRIGFGVEKHHLDDGLARLDRFIGRRNG